MLQFPEIDPVLVAIGPLKIHWYGVMYLLAFVAAWFIGTRRSRTRWSALQPAQVEDLIFFGALGVVLGGRCGYVFFYGFDQFLADPLWLFKIWEGGMSFHGGLLGVFAAIIYYTRRVGCTHGELCDFVAPLAPLGLGFGRLANFINAELYGRATDVPWGMVFPTDPEGLARHPSQLYQFFLEGVVLFLIVWWYSRRPRPVWSVTGLFLVVYGSARFGVEFFRQPDAGIGFDLLGWMTRGQLLSLPMIVGGVCFWIYAWRSGVMPRERDLAVDAGEPKAKGKGVGKGACKKKQRQKNRR